MSFSFAALRLSLLIQCAVYPILAFEPLFAADPLVVFGSELDPEAAALGPSGSGGGDSCEIRFKSVAKDIADWVYEGGGDNLDFSSTQTNPDDYKKRMLNKLGRARVTCVGPGEPGFPVLVNGKPKECRSFEEAGILRILCDRKKFYSDTHDPDNDPSQYRMVHHEYATLAMLEVPTEDDSNYALSNQVTGYLEEKVVHRLAVKPAQPSRFLNKRKEDVGSAIYGNARKQLEIYRYFLKLAGRSMSKIKLSATDGFGQELGFSFETTGSRSLNCAPGVLDSDVFWIPWFRDLKTQFDDFLRVRGVDPRSIVDVKAERQTLIGPIESVKVYYCQ